jgi:PAS domain S-box-containing protein
MRWRTSLGMSVTRGPSMTEQAIVNPNGDADQALADENVSDPKKETWLGADMDRLADSLADIGEGVVVVGRDRMVKYQSKLLTERFGDVVGSACHKAYADSDRICQPCPLNDGAGPQSLEPMEVKARDGRCYQVFPATRNCENGATELVEIWRDVTGMKKTQENIAFLKGIMNHASESIIATDEHGRIIYANPATETMFGYSAEELKGKDLELLATELYRERIDKQIFGTGATGKMWSGEILNRRKDGKLLYVSTSVSKMVDKEGSFIALVWFQKDVTQTKRYQEEMIKIEKEKAETLRILHENEAAINRSLSKTKRELQEKNLELERRTFELEEEKGRLKEAYDKLNQMQAQLLQSEKLASLGQLSAGVAHELNNPIGFVHSNLGTLAEYVRDVKSLLEKYASLEKRMPPDKPCRELTREIEEFKQRIGLQPMLDDFDKIISESQEGAQRVKNIVQNLKDFAHRDRTRLELADINKGIESTLNIVWNELKYKATVTKKYGLIPQIECFPQQLNQVFMNLLVNAAQAIEEKGEITIKTYQAGKTVVVEISDTGVGISEENLEHIFEPFFTTKEVGKGTGLGLSVVYGIIENHGGKIEVESQVGKGSMFRVILPVRGSPVPLDAKEEAEADKPST